MECCPIGREGVQGLSGKETLTRPLPLVPRPQDPAPSFCGIRAFSLPILLSSSAFLFARNSLCTPLPAGLTLPSFMSYLRPIYWVPLPYVSMQRCRLPGSVPAVPGPVLAPSEVPGSTSLFSNSSRLCQRYKPASVLSGLCFIGRLYNAGS